MSGKTKIILEKLDQIKVNLGKFMVEGGVDIGSHRALRQLIEEAERLVDFAELDKWESAPSASTNSASAPLFTKAQLIDFAKYHSIQEYNNDKFEDPSYSFDEWLNNSAHS